MTPRAMVTYIYKDDWKIYLKNKPNKVDGGGSKVETPPLANVWTGIVGEGVINMILNFCLPHFLF